jgi:hypothetical protein
MLMVAINDEAVGLGASVQLSFVREVLFGIQQLETWQ